VRRLAGVMAAAILSSGCLVVSLQPVYDEQSITFDEGLLGTWTNTEDRTTAVIDRAEWRSYRVVFTDRSSTFTFHANLTTIGPTMFLDLTQSRGTDPGPYLVPVHGIYRVSLTADTLTAAALDYNWYSRAANARTPGSLMASFDDRRNVAISSPTESLRAYLATAPADAFGAAATYKRGSAQER
jgi:hypothetical protein